MARIAQLISISFLLLTISCAHYTSERRHPQCEEIISKGNCIAVLPPRARVNMVTYHGKAQERMYNYEYRIEDLIADEAVKIMRDKGYNVELVTKRKLRDKKSFRDYDMSSDRLEEVTKDFYLTRTLMEKEKAYAIERNVGRRAIAVAKSTKNDLLLYINYINNVKSNSARMVGFLFGSLAGGAGNYDANSATILFRVVDGKNGHVLWSNTARDQRSLIVDMFSGKDDEADRMRVRGLMEQVMSSLPNKSNLVAESLKLVKK